MMEQLCMLYEEKTQEADEKHEEVLKCRQLLLDRFLQLKQRRSDLEAKYSACAELHGNVKADGNDIIQLNVGGVGVVAKRSVLTLFRDSKLAVLFSGRWDKKLLRDKKNRIFLDVDPVCFQIILDYLTQCLELPGDAPFPSLPEVNKELKTTFDCLCTFFNIAFPKDACTSAPEKVKKNKHIQTAVSDGESVEDSCDALKAVLKEERSILDSMEQALAEEESSFLGEEMFVTFFAGGETKDIVQLNVSGGEVMSVRRSTLRLCEGSVLYHQFDDTVWCQGNKRKRESEEDIDTDSDNDAAGVLIDQSPYAFGKLINQLRLKAIMPPGVKVPRPYIAEQEMTNFEAVVQYYFPGQEELILPEMASFTSDILAEEDHKLLLEGWVAESEPDLDTEVTLSLLYRGSRDGFRGADFHAKCDDKDATVTIVKSTEGYIFGGYSDQSWKSYGGCWKSSSRAFLFSIVNPAGLAPMKLPLTGERNNAAVYCYPTCGPLFGGGHDLCIHDNCNTVKKSYSLLGRSYTLPPGQDRKTFLAGSQYFRVAEIEVFAVQQQQQQQQE
jgi:hypothetical protein